MLLLGILVALVIIIVITICVVAICYLKKINKLMAIALSVPLLVFVMLAIYGFKEFVFIT